MQVDMRNTIKLKEKFIESKELLSKRSYPYISNESEFIETHKSILFDFFVQGVNKTLEGMRENNNHERPVLLSLLDIDDKHSKEDYKMCLKYLNNFTKVNSLYKNNIKYGAHISSSDCDFKINLIQLLTCLVKKVDSLKR